MKKVDFLITVVVSLLVYFGMAIPWSMELKAHQPGPGILNPTDFPIKAAWIYPIPFALMSLCITAALILFFRRFSFSKSK